MRRVRNKKPQNKFVRNRLEEIWKFTGEKCCVPSGPSDKRDTNKVVPEP